MRTLVGSPLLKLKSTERGLIVGPGFRFDEKKTTSADIIKSALFFWDRINVPAGGLGIPSNPPDQIGFPSTQKDLNFLLNEGIIQRTPVFFEDIGRYELDLWLDTVVFNDLEKSNPGQWSIGRENIYQHYLPEPELTKNRGLVYRLHDAIPVPHYDVPFEDILEFKERRGDELITLRHHLELVYQSIIQSPDRTHAKQVNIENLDKAISEHIRVCRESKMKLSLSPLSGSVDIGSGALATIGAMSLGLPITQALIAGAGAATLSFKTGFGLKPGQRQSNVPFEYMIGIQKEFR